jgi:hypothetical protein
MVPTIIKPEARRKLEFELALERGDDEELERRGVAVVEAARRARAEA